MPTLGSVLHVNQALTNFAIAWKPPSEKSGWFARQDFFGTVPVSKPSDIVRSVSQGAMLQRYTAAVGVDAKHVPRVEFRIGANITFQCIPRTIEGVINNYEERVADSALQYAKNQMMMPRWAMEMDNESMALAVLLNTSNYASGNVITLASTDYFDNFASLSSNPWDAINEGLWKIAFDTGNKANRLGMTAPAWSVLQRHPALVKRANVNQGGNGPAFLTKQIFESLFEEFLEPGSLRIYRGTYNNQVSPNDDDPKDLRFFFGPGMVAAYVKDGADLEDLSFAKQFMFNGLDGVDPMIVLEIEDKTIVPIGGSILRLCTSVDWKVTHKQSAVIWPAVIDKTNARYVNEAGNSYYV